MPQCKNEEMNKVGLGQQPSYPRSCPTCKFGPCSRDVKRDSESTIEERYYVRTNAFSYETAPKYKYAVLYDQSIYHEGDERSRTNPGHGYPAYTETIHSVETFDDEAALKNWIERNYSKTFTAIRYEELRVMTRLEVSLG